MPSILKHLGRGRAWALYLCMLALCLCPGGVLATEANADVVVLRNGDIHQGTLRQSHIVLDTSFGKITLPIDRVAEFRAGTPGSAADRLFTIEGERFTGRLATGDLQLRRVLEPVLQINTADVARLAFAPRATRPASAGTPDLVETRNGDLFRARVLIDALRLRDDAGTHQLSTSAIHLLDTDREDDGIHAQISFNTLSSRAHGLLLDEVLEVETRSGDRLRLPAADITAIAFSVLPTERNMPGSTGLVSCRHSPCFPLRDTLRDGTLGPEMVVVRGGSFVRGDLHGDGRPDERPPTPVRLERPFAIGKYEITFEEYDQFCTATRRPRPDDSDWGRDRRPVVNVSWDDAVAYAQWLSTQTGQRYRLPTDAEWEYAARGGTTTRYWWGDEVGSGHANCAGCGSLWDARSSAPVGRFPANPFGLHDTAGNVFEWVADCYHDTFAKAPDDGSAHENPAGCGQRVYRGGSWGFPPREARSSNRWRDFATGSSDDMGFRLVRELTP